MGRRLWWPRTIQDCCPEHKEARLMPQGCPAQNILFEHRMQESMGHSHITTGESSDDKVIRADTRRPYDLSSPPALQRTPTSGASCAGIASKKKKARLTISASYPKDNYVVGIAK